MSGLADAYKTAIRRWVLEEGLSDDRLGNNIIVTFDAGPDREQAWEFVNELRSDSRIDRRRRPGRPALTQEAFWANLLDARHRCDRPVAVQPTTEELAEKYPKREQGSLVRGVTREYLEDLIQRFGLPPDW